MKKQKVTSQINLERLAGGAFTEKLNEALMQVAENIQNPNTEATTKRQINIAIKFAPNKSRQVINTQISVTTKLAATEAIDTQMVMGVNARTGQMEIFEYDGQIRGQMRFSNFSQEQDTKQRKEKMAETTEYLVPGEDFDPDTGEIYESVGDRRTSAGQTKGQPKNEGKIAVMERATAQE